jgi:hypothetical protein
VRRTGCVGEGEGQGRPGSQDATSGTDGGDMTKGVKPLGEERIELGRGDVH